MSRTRVFSHLHFAEADSAAVNSSDGATFIQRTINTFGPGQGIKAIGTKYHDATNVIQYAEVNLIIGNEETTFYLQTNPVWKSFSGTMGQYNFIIILNAVDFAQNLVSCLWGYVDNVTQPTATPALTVGTIDLTDPIIGPTAEECED